ncbi:MAG: DEAD/DEAH box helicase [Bacteroidota bacterium]
MRFEDLNLNKGLWNALADLGIEETTPIQAKTFSPIMSGKDIVGIAQTGTGKTFAFLLPLLRLWKFSKSPNPRILILVPTRELVAQVVEAIESLTTYLNVVAVGVYGGTNIKTHKGLVAQGCDIVVGTPGRVVDLMVDGILKPKEINKLVVDEIDEMLHMGFRTQLKHIVDLLPPKRQHLMFSATLSEEVEAVIDLFSEYYTKIEAAPSGAPLENINQVAYSLPNFNSKVNFLKHFLETDSTMTKVLIFASTKKFADALFEALNSLFPEMIGIIHASKSQNFRFASVEKFLNGDTKVLVATDLIARGLDIQGITHVINFDTPDHPEKYIHRIGRTGRAQEKGQSILFTNDQEQDQFVAIEVLMEMEIPVHELPEEVQLNDELIDLEIQPDFVPYNNHKQKQHKPSGPAFHPKKRGGE